MAEVGEESAHEDEFIFSEDRGVQGGEGGTSQTAQSTLLGEAIFKGRKERRRSSAFKTAIGDYKNISGNEKVQKTLAKYGEKTVLFSDEMMKVNRRNKMQKRVLMITENALYNLDPNNYKVKRRISLDNLGSISLSTLSDNFFAVHVPSEYDYLLVSAKKTEVLCVVADQYHKVHGRPLNIQFSDRFDYRIDANTLREILFMKVPGGVNTQIFTKPRK